MVSSRAPWAESESGALLKDIILDEKCPMGALPKRLGCALHKKHPQAHSLSPAPKVLFRTGSALPSKCPGGALLKRPSGAVGRKCLGGAFLGRHLQGTLGQKRPRGTQEESASGRKAPCRRYFCEVPFGCFYQHISRGPCSRLCAMAHWGTVGYAHALFLKMLHAEEHPRELVVFI